MLRTTDELATSVMPPAWPYFAIPCVYRDVQFRIARLRVSEDALVRLLPAPLEGAGSGVCTVTCIDVPYSSSYGRFQESFVQLQCRWRGETASYVPYVFLNNTRAICAGREIYGTPKVWADVSLERRGDDLTSQTSIDGVELIRQHIRIQGSIKPEALPDDGPSYRLKLIPSVDGSGPCVKQLVTATPSDLQLRDLWQGSAEVGFGSVGGLDLRSLQPIETLTAYGFVASYVEGWGEVAFDYLTGAAERSP
jgi:acetoacetate decarboxylase